MVNHSSNDDPLSYHGRPSLDSGFFHGIWWLTMKKRGRPLKNIVTMVIHGHYFTCEKMSASRANQTLYTRTTSSTGSA